jgi:hypothetical protein
MLRIVGGVCLSAVVTLSVAHAQSPVSEVKFDLSPNPAFKTCLGPNPQAHVKVTRGELNDTLDISISGIHPNLQFDLFTVQRSSLDNKGEPVADFKGFGLAWYQTDLNADKNGEGTAEIKTILLDQIFGFDGRCRRLCRIGEPEARGHRADARRAFAPSMRQKIDLADPLS